MRWWRIWRIPISLIIWNELQHKCLFLWIIYSLLVQIKKCSAILSSVLPIKKLLVGQMLQVFKKSVDSSYLRRWCFSNIFLMFLKRFTNAKLTDGNQLRRDVCADWQMFPAQPSNPSHSVSQPSLELRVDIFKLNYNPSHHPPGLSNCLLKSQNVLNMNLCYGFSIF